ncbi:Copia protein, partial [Mucuna pruriens]
MLKYFLNIEVAYSNEGIFISQQKYVTKLLAEIGNLGCKPITTYMDPNNKLGEGKEEPIVDKHMYQILMGKLIYLAHTRPNIAYLVSVISSQFLHNPRESHLQVAYKVLHYLKSTLETYTDVDYAKSLVDKRSTIGYCTFLRGNLVTRRNKKAISQGLYELLWLKIILDDLRITLKGLMKLYCYNKRTINITYNLMIKHIEIDKHFIKEEFEEGLLCMSYVLPTQQLANVLTK